MSKGKTPAEIQADILSVYFKHLASFGYLDNARTIQLLTAVLLLDTIEFFSDYVDSTYINKIERYLRKAQCCNCAIKFSRINTVKCFECDEEAFKFIDLGLPSGTLWANRNIGAVKNTDIGQYFSWGELEQKSGWDGQGEKVPYTWENYRFTGPSLTASKYNSTDGLINLELEDDVAYLSYGEECSLPTVAQCEELVQNTTHVIIQIDGISGALCTSNINGKSIFIPNSGELYNLTVVDSSRAMVLTNERYLNSNEGAYYLGFFPSEYSPSGQGYDINSFAWNRSIGVPARAVRNVITNTK